MGTERCNEIDLIQQTLSGDTSAFDQLVKMHRRTIYVLVLSYIKNAADAEDLTQRIFIRAYERLSTLRELDCFLPWLQQIAHNTCKDWLRRRSELVASLEVVKSSAFSETAPSAEDIVLKAEVEDIVRKAINGLTETDRKLMEGHYIEGASYDELRAESGLSYAAIANRLKRAKREVRRRVRKLLGGVMVLPGRTVIWGGIETVKLSAKMKLATVAATAIIGIGGGGVLYHHTSQLEPVVANKQKAQKAQTAMVDSSTDMSSTNYSRAADSSARSEPTITEKKQSDIFEIATDDGTKTVQVRDLYERPEALSEELTAPLHNRAEQHAPRVGDKISIMMSADGAVIVESEAGVTIDSTIEDLPEMIRRTSMNPEMDASARELAIQIGQTLEVVFMEEHLSNMRLQNADMVVLQFEGLPDALDQLKQKIAIIPKAAIDEITESPAIVVTESPPPISTESHTQSTVTAPTVESTAIPSRPSREITPLADGEWAEFERLLSVSGEFSDEEWADLERLLDTATGRTTTQQHGQAPPNTERERSERLLEELPAAPAERQEMWRQQPDLPESNSDVPPYPTTEEWRRTME